MMSCRVCLRKNMRVYYKLNNSFNDLIGRLADVKMVVNDLVCCFCITTLRKIQKFIYTVQEVNSILKLPIKTEENEDEVTCHKLYNFTVSIRDNYSLGSFQSVCDTYPGKGNEEPCEVTTNILKIELIKEEPKQSSDCDNMDTETDQKYYNVPLTLTTAADKSDNKMILNHPSEKYGECLSTQMTTRTVEGNNTETEPSRRVSRQVIGAKPNDPQSKDVSNNGETKCVTYKTLSCTMCAYKTIWKSALTKHLRTHTGEKPYSCHLCSFKCSSSSSLTRHAIIHTGEKPFACDICLYKCNRRTYLEQHLRTHTGEKPFFCNECTYKSSSKSHLTKHLRIHSGEKRWSCDRCSYKCDRRKDLKLHLKKHEHE